MEKKYIVSGIIVLVVLIGGFVIIKNSKTTTTVDFSATSTAPGKGAGEIIPTVGSDPNKASVGAAGGQTTNSPATVVIYTEQGFTPEIVTIKKGGSVTFRNKSGRDMWVASNPHPTHTFYPEKSASDCLGSSFDACRGVAAGADWSFAFKSLGRWRYHDHLREDSQGTVIVE